MKQFNKLKNVYVCLLLISVLIGTLTTGCGSAGFKKPITKFRDASSVVIESTKIYLSELNKTERDKYILEKLSEKELIKLDEINKIQVFSEEGLKARVDALDVLANYGDLLLKLANSDAPEKVTAQAANLKDSLTNLSGTVSGFTGADNSNFKSAIGPITQILSTVLDLVVQQKIKEGLQEAVLKGEAPINALINVIGEDLRLAYERKRNFYSESRRFLVDDFNKSQEIFDQMRKDYEKEEAKGAEADKNKLLALSEKMTALSEKMKVYADRVREHENKWEQLGNTNPKESLGAMAKAHTALVNYAKSKKKISDFSSLVDSMEFFATRALQFGEAVRALQEI